MSYPETKQELQSYIGTLNLVSVFIPNLAQKTFLCGLLKNNVQYVWTSDMQKEFENAQKANAEATLLHHFNPKLPVIMETDASLKGLRTVLMQDGRPVWFLRKESDIGWIKLLKHWAWAVCHAACREKLHVYTFGRPVHIHTDHKPLENIFQQPVSLAPPLLGCWHVSVCMMYMWSMLEPTRSWSRTHSPDTSQVKRTWKSRDDVKIATVIKVHQTRLAPLQDETKNDPVLQNLQKLVYLGWPESMQDLPEPLRAHWCFWNELAIHDGILLKGNRIIIPSSLRPEYLDKLHDGHQGLSSTLRRARHSVYWPRMQDDIQNTIQSCDQCHIHVKQKP